MSDRTSFYPELAKSIAPAQRQAGRPAPGPGRRLDHADRRRPPDPQGPREALRLGDPDAEAASGQAHATRSFTPVKELVPLAELEDLVFGGWDLFPDNSYEAAVKAGVLSGEMLTAVRPELEAVKPMPAVFERAWVKNLDGPNVKKAPSKMELAQALIRDIAEFRKKHGAARAVMVWCGSTEVYSQPTPVHESLAAFEKGLKESSPDIAPSMIYAYAAIASGVPYANGAPNLTVDVPALTEMARARGVPIAGKDFKTGQTLMKTIIAPGLKARMLGLQGWFSTNILGNRDGEVLDDPGSFRSKEVSKASVLDAILQPELYPELYGDYFHKVRIEYYPPRGDAKEGWDNIDIVGWLGQPMQIKIDFLCRDSILAAPVVLDLLLFLDLARARRASRASRSGCPSTSSRPCRGRT